MKDLLTFPDPKNMGLTPKEISITVPDDDWKNVRDDQYDNIFNWSDDFINKMLPNPVTTESLTETFLKHAAVLTTPMRSFMETNPSKKVPPDYRSYPGKLDHTTCLAFNVGSTPRDTNNIVVRLDKQDADAVRDKTDSYTEIIFGNDTADDSKTDLHAAVWFKYFGDHYVKAWEEFIAGLKLTLTPEGEEQLRTIIGKFVFSKR